MLVFYLLTKRTWSSAFRSSRQLALNLHNRYRSLVASGGAQSRLAGALPPATRMRKLVYSEELEAIAAQTAKRCDISQVKRAF